MGLDTLDETKPFDTDPVSLGDDEIRATRAATKQSFSMEHYLSGEHGFPIGGPTTNRPAAGKVGRLFINTSNNTVEYDNGSTWIATGASLVPGSVDSTVLANNSVTNDKLANNSVTGNKIADGTITAADIADGSITASKLSGAISGSLIADKSIWGDAKIADNSIVGFRQLYPGTVNLQQLGVGAAVAGVGYHRRTDTVVCGGINAETLYLEYTWNSRGGWYLTVNALHVVFGIDTAGGAVASNLRLDGSPGVANNGGILDFQWHQGATTANTIVVVPATLVTGMLSSGLAAGTHRIKVTLVPINRFVAFVHIDSGWGAVIEVA
jgi:hypothetical protein